MFETYLLKAFCLRAFSSIAFKLDTCTILLISRSRYDLSLTCSLARNVANISEFDSLPLRFTRFMLDIFVYGWYWRDTIPLTNNYWHLILFCIGQQCYIHPVNRMLDAKQQFYNLKMPRSFATIHSTVTYLTTVHYTNF